MISYNYIVLGILGVTVLFPEKTEEMSKIINSITITERQTSGDLSKITRYKTKYLKHGNKYISKLYNVPVYKSHKYKVEVVTTSLLAHKRANGS